MLLGYSDWYVLALAIVCLYAILQIKFDFAFYIGTSENAEKWNQIIDSLSYSYLAAYFFYILTVKLPYWETKSRLFKALDSKYKLIKTNYHACLESVLPIDESLKINMTKEEIIDKFKSKSYLEPCKLSKIGQNASVASYIKIKHNENKRIAGEIIEYKVF